MDTEQPNLEFNNSVKILTLHKSKGLEFPLVIIPGVNKENYKLRDEDFISTLFPNLNSKLDLERAFYVAITRAKSKLIISYSGNPKYYIERLKSGDIFGNSNNKELIESVVNENIEIETSIPEKETLELTYYKLIEFWKCPFAYKLRFYHNLIIPRTFTLTFGSILHSLLYHLNLAIKNHEKYDLDKLIEEKVPTYLKNIHFKLMLEKYLSTFKEELKQIVAIEKPFEFAIGDSIINGRIDLIVKNKQGKYTIVEFKSGPRRRGNDESLQDYEEYVKRQKEDTKKQINLYSLSQTDYNISKGIIYFFGGDSEPISFSINKEQMKLDIFEAITKISNKNFDPINNLKGANCVFQEYNICPYSIKIKHPTLQNGDSDEEDEEKRDFCCEL